VDVPCWPSRPTPTSFPHETNIVAATTITGDFMCRATNVTYRMDTPSARAFLGQYVKLTQR